MNNEVALINMRKACQVVAEVLKKIKFFLKPGISTKKLDQIAEEIIRSNGAEPAFKGYKGYPACICTSINYEVVHGIPSEKRILKQGDIISIDVGTKINGYYGDAAATFAVDEVPLQAKRLIQVTKDALYKAIEKARPGIHLSDISHTIEMIALKNKYSVVREWAGHYIGEKLHLNPQIPNFGPPGKGPILKEGDFLAIEPMINLGTWKTKILDDNWTVITADKKLSAHFEHTIAILKDKTLVLTEFE